MKQYKVLKDLINAPVGTILTNKEGQKGLYKDKYTNSVLTCYEILDATYQGFIEPYTPEPKHWRAEKYTTYYYVCTMLDTIEARADQQLEFDNSKYNSGNYFKSQATAELVAKAQKLFFEWLHDKEAEGISEDLSSFSLTSDLCVAMDEARKACEKDDSNE